MRTNSVYLIIFAACAVVALGACARNDRQADAAAGARRATPPGATPSLCPPAPDGIIVSFDKVAYFPARAECRSSSASAPRSATRFTTPSVGRLGERSFHSPARCSSRFTPAISRIRFPSTSRTCGLRPGILCACPTASVFRARSVRCEPSAERSVDKNEGGDDWNGPGARTCRFPEILFKLDGTGQPKTLPDSARVTSIEIDVRRRETMAFFCSR